MLYRSYSSRETKQLARGMKSRLLPNRNKAVLVRLEGGLGSGKTVLVQGLAASFGAKTRVTSPTFILARRYQVKRGPFRRIFHIDCYRLHDPRELRNLGLRAVLENPENLVLVEWPELAGKFFSDYDWRFVFQHRKKENERAIACEKR